MGKKRKAKWDRKRCGCINTELPRMGPAVIRCARHLGKRSKRRLVCHFDENGILRVG